jgi:hypothetical protein
MNIFAVLAIAFVQISCANDYETKVYYGNNKYYIPAEIVETKTIWDSQEIKEFSRNTYKRLQKNEGEICTIIMCNNSPYAIAYNDIDPITGKPKDTVINYQDILAKKERLVKRFESIKSKTEAKSHEIYGHYFVLGNSANSYDGSFLVTITKDSNNNYFESSMQLCDDCVPNIKPAIRTNEGFEVENEYWQGYDKPMIKAKEIYYEKNGYIITKNLHYVGRNDEKYVLILMKMK